MKKCNSHLEKGYFRFNNIQNYKLTNDKQIHRENLSSSVENESTYLHYLTCDGEF